MAETSLYKRLASGERLLMDGGMGSEIEYRGLPSRLPLWSAEVLLTHPEVVLHIHEDYINAGAEIITTNTFRTTRRMFAREGIAEQAAAAAALACSLARQARDEARSDREIFIAGSLAPLEECYSPALTPPQSEIEAEHAELVSQLQAGGVDFILLETMITARETLSGVQAARRSNLPFAVSFCCNAQLALLSGEPLWEVVPEVAASHPLFIGVNCVSTDIATRTVRHLRELTTLPIGVYAQGDGLADHAESWQMASERHLPAYLRAAPLWLVSGAQVIGGCCGTTPAYIHALRQLLDEQA